MGEGLGAFLAHPAFQELSAYLEVPGAGQDGPERGRDPEAARPARALDTALSCSSGSEPAQTALWNRTSGECDVVHRRRMTREMTFAQAAEAHLDDVYGYLVWFTGDRAAAEDLAGETFERALRLWHRFDPDRGSARTWLCQVARTVALDHFRSERRRTRREQLAALPERFEERFVEGLSPELEAALRALSRRRARGGRAPRRARPRRADRRRRCSASRPRTARRA